MASVCRELTKMYEECVTKPLPELIEYFDTEKKVRGEIVIIVEGKAIAKKKKKDKYK